MIARVGSLVTFTCSEVVSLLLQTSCRRESYSLGKPKRLLSFATSQELRDPSARVQQRCLFFLSLLPARCGSPQHPSHYDACFSKLHQPHQILLCLCAVFFFLLLFLFVYYFSHSFYLPISCNIIVEQIMSYIFCALHYYQIQCQADRKYSAKARWASLFV